MAITFPRELYSYELAVCTFSLMDGVALNRAANGRVISAVDQFDPWILGKFKTRRLMPAERRAWVAWKNSLQGGMKSFLAWDASRQYPITYPNGVPEIIASTWDGEGTLSALAARQLTVGGAPTGFTLVPGDHVGLVEGGAYGVFDVTETAVAGASTMTISVDPFVPLTVFTTAATVVLFRPKARFVLDPDSWEDEGDIEFSPISFQGFQRY